MSEYVSLKATDGDHGKAEYVDTETEEKIPFLRVQNIKIGYLNKEGLVYISEKKQAKLQRSCVQRNDVLVTKTGSIGQSVVYTSSIEANCSCHVAIITPSDNIIPDFLALFLNSNFGYLQMERLTIKATRPEFKINEMHAIQVPLPPKDIQQKVLSRFKEVSFEIDSILQQAQHLRVRANDILSAAKANIFDLLDDKKYQLILAMADEALKTGTTSEVAV